MGKNYDLQGEMLVSENTLGWNTATAYIEFLNNAGGSVVELLPRIP